MDFQDGDETDGRTVSCLCFSSTHGTSVAAAFPASFGVLGWQEDLSDLSDLAVSPILTQVQILNSKPADATATVPTLPLTRAPGSREKEFAALLMSQQYLHISFPKDGEPLPNRNLYTPALITLI